MTILLHLKKTIRRVDDGTLTQIDALVQKEVERRLQNDAKSEVHPR